MSINPDFNNVDITCEDGATRTFTEYLKWRVELIVADYDKRRVELIVADYDKRIKKLEAEIKYMKDKSQVYGK